MCGGIFEESGGQLAEQLVVVRGTGDSDRIGLHAVGNGSMDKCCREDFEQWYERDDLVAAVHSLLIVCLHVWGHLDYFFFCHRNCLEGIEYGIAEGGAMSDSWVDIDQVSDCACRVMTNGINCDEDFVFFQPHENGGSGVSALFHL